jgi:hypothetical protein
MGKDRESVPPSFVRPGQNPALDEALSRLKTDGGEPGGTAVEKRSAEPAEDTPREVEKTREAAAARGRGSWWAVGLAAVAIGGVVAVMALAVMGQRGQAGEAGGAEVDVRASAAPSVGEPGATAASHGSSGTGAAAVPAAASMAAGAGTTAPESSAAAPAAMSGPSAGARAPETAPRATSSAGPRPHGAALPDAPATTATAQPEAPPDPTVNAPQPKIRF